MTPKDGSPGSVLTPVAPKAVQEADTADPGEVSESKQRQLETQSGKYGSARVKPFKPVTPEQAAQEQREVSWIEIQLVGEDDKPIPGERYRITLPDQSVTEGTLDQRGFARVQGFDPGSCTITFPELDEEAWKDA